MLPRGYGPDFGSSFFTKFYGAVHCVSNSAEHRSVFTAAKLFKKL